MLTPTDSGDEREETDTISWSPEKLEQIYFHEHRQYNKSKLSSNIAKLWQLFSLKLFTKHNYYIEANKCSIKEIHACIFFLKNPSF